MHHTGRFFLEALEDPGQDIVAQDLAMWWFYCPNHDKNFVHALHPLLFLEPRLSLPLSCLFFFVPHPPHLLPLPLFLLPLPLLLHFALHPLPFLEPILFLPLPILLLFALHLPVLLPLSLFLLPLPLLLIFELHPLPFLEPLLSLPLSCLLFSALHLPLLLPRPLFLLPLPLHLSPLVLEPHMLLFCPLIRLLLACFPTLIIPFLCSCLPPLIHHRNVAFRHLHLFLQFADDSQTPLPHFQTMPLLMFIILDPKVHCL
ncbi:unnamed protein product [Closterium sp. NIES-53]